MSLRAAWTLYGASKWEEQINKTTWKLIIIRHSSDQALEVAGTQESSLALLVPSDLIQHFGYYTAILLMSSTGPSCESVLTHGVDSTYPCPLGAQGNGEQMSHSARARQYVFGISLEI